MICECGKSPDKCGAKICPFDLWITSTIIRLSMRYVVKVKEHAAIVTYEDGIVKNIELPSAISDVQAGWIKSSLPAKENELFAWAAGSDKITVEEVPEDLSFNEFWTTYDYKVGKKDRALALWAALPAEERAQALRAIPKYKYWLAQRPAIEKLYPETYLKQKRYQNEFKR